MPNKHFCQGPHCHEQITQDRFLKSRGVIRGRYAYATMDRTPNQYGQTLSDADRFFCGQRCKMEWLELNMDNVEHGRPIEFIRHRRESQGYAKVKNEDSYYGASHSIERVDNRTEIEQDNPITERYKMSKLKDATMIDATEERKNRFNGETVLLTPHEAKIHDDIFINELEATIEDKEIGIDGHSKKWQLVRDGLNYFRKNNAEAYMVLLD